MPQDSRWPALALLLLLGWACAPAEQAADPSPELPPLREGQTSFVEADGDGRLHMEVVGEGAPIVVVHGGPGMDSRYLRRGLEPLADMAQLVFYDQRGTGLSEGPLSLEVVNFLQFVEDIDAVRSALGVERINVLGHSFGGRLAMEYALRHPEHVERLILVNTTEPGQRFIQEANERRAERVTQEDQQSLEGIGQSGRLQTGDTVAFREFYEAAFRSNFADPARLADLDLSMHPNTAKNGLRVITDVGGSVGDASGWDALRGVQAPTLILQGEEDLMPVGMAVELADSIPQATLARIPDAGHFPWIEQPDAFLEAFRTWWEG